MINSLSPSISYVKGREDIPCPNIYIVSGKESSLLIDVSNDPSMLEEAINYIKDKKLAPLKKVAITHFHPDHIDNLKYLPSGVTIYSSKYTSRYINQEVSIIIQDTTINLGDKEVRLILVPSLHSKGSLDVLVDSYLFVGDSLEPREGKDGLYYDNSIAYEMEKRIKEIPFDYGVEAHPSPILTRQEVLDYLLTLKNKGWASLI
jgi:glyoxylase-like metal-dependent hydrolase (beta-lactamase superfamily II)